MSVVKTLYMLWYYANVYYDMIDHILIYFPIV